jgi:dTDP-4-dehydrorhamnose 3,5-epimerase
MKFMATRLKGAFIIEPERLNDNRGFFARTWCKHEFMSHGLNPNLVQCNISFNTKKGTLRGMHHQVAPHEEAKIVRCTAGAIYDVIIDLRSTSPTFKKWLFVELSAVNRKMIYIPEGFSHGFMTLQDNTEVLYQMSDFFAPECARGIRWNDPSFNIKWPLDVAVISEKDSQYHDFESSHS